MLLHYHWPGIFRISISIRKSIERINNALNEIYFLAQGGTAVGTGINTKKNFDKKIVK